MPLRLMLLASTMFVVACGSGSGDLTYPADGSDEEQISAVVDYWNTAAEDLDAAVLCEQVLPPSIRRGASTEECAGRIQVAMDEAPGNWENELTALSDVKVAGDSATASALQDEEESEYDFVRERERWWMVVFD